MSTITKEWLESQISAIKVVGITDSNTLQAFEIALASLEAERGKVRRFDLDMSDCDSCGQDCGADMVEDLDGEYVLFEEVLPYLNQYADCAAMLQGAEPVSNRDELTDGWVACSERLPPEGYEPDGGAVCYLVWHKNEVDCGPQYSISNVFFLRKHWEKNFTHWMPLPAAPQQEVK